MFNLIAPDTVNYVPAVINMFWFVGQRAGKKKSIHKEPSIKADINDKTQLNS
jgi:hypothetical protein